jgi:hypothetical protein
LFLSVNRGPSLYELGPGSKVNNSVL